MGGAPGISAPTGVTAYFGGRGGSPFACATKQKGAPSLEAIFAIARQGEQPEREVRYQRLNCDQYDELRDRTDGEGRYSLD
jgi:hypothetical protein